MKSAISRKGSLFINLEGMHGVGKSTVQAELCKIDKSLCTIDTIPGHFASTRSIVDSQFNVDTRYLAYLSAVSMQGSVVEQALRNGQNVLTESYAFRTIAFHESMGSKLRIDPKDLSIVMPTHNFLLVCCEGERKKRLRMRNGAQSYWRSRAEGVVKMIHSKYKTFKMDIIDVTEITAAEAAALIKERIKQKG